jgi:hypothetical protein
MEGEAPAEPYIDPQIAQISQMGFFLGEPQMHTDGHR